jgi:hypothetical protein
VDELRIDSVGEVQGKDGCEGNRLRRVGIDEDGVGVDLIADEMKFVSAAERRNFLQRLDGLPSVSCDTLSPSMLEGTCITSSEGIVRAKTRASGEVQQVQRQVSVLTWSAGRPGL